MCIYLDRVYESVAWNNNTVGSSQTSKRLQRKAKSSSSFHERNLDDLNTKELDFIEYSLKEESGVAQTRVGLCKWK